MGRLPDAFMVFAAKFGGFPVSLGRKWLPWSS